MWLMGSEIPLRLEILDQTGQRLFDAPARLKHLDETFAIMGLEEPISAARLHWGAPVRFELEDGLRRYEITGAIVARQEEETEAGDDIGLEALERPSTWEVRIRVWECSLNVQRRSLPRRKLKFPVQLRVLCPGEGLGDPDEEHAETIQGWCVDIGAGGIRVRTRRMTTVPNRMVLGFCLPVSAGANGVAAAHDFFVAGKVIRADPQGRHGDNTEIALHFERISVRDGLVLHNLLA